MFVYIFIVHIHNYRSLLNIKNIFFVNSCTGHATVWKRCLTVSLSEEPNMPVIATEIPGPRSRSLFQELNAIQVRSKSNFIYNSIMYVVFRNIYLSFSPTIL